ncbi:hypothetical protein [Halobacterium salinarum]|uniref:Uncharacterized protein n=2 Tax=Halobacterium salinarum TaxID=2242 RepID=A0A4D6GWJ6_HALS9|nr:hypothetical protein [Halobacterium salinarum]QCC45871.1 uncharacterized protein HBSAL_11145 [Halobacterium salinarum]TYO82130.1 hypothetical protein APQ99_00648 [Halobacterium salinarum DSM 3754]
MRTTDGGFRAEAVTALAARDYHHASDAYARAGWRVLSAPRNDPDVAPFDPGEKGWVGSGLAHLAASTAAARVAGTPARATDRAVHGVAAARDLRRAYADTHPARAACFDEFIADFHALGGLDGVGDAYEDAAAAHREAAGSVASPQTLATTPLFEAAAVPVKQLARGQADGEIAVSWDDLHGGDPGDPGAFLAHRATYKRQRLPGLVEAAVDDGHLAAPRGTTEYATDHHECPACGSRHVNWIADSTLCLVCSRPTEPTNE